MIHCISIYLLDTINEDEENLCDSNNVNKSMVHQISNFINELLLIYCIYS